MGIFKDFEEKFVIALGILGCIAVVVIGYMWLFNNKNVDNNYNDEIAVEDNKEEIDSTSLEVGKKEENETEKNIDVNSLNIKEESDKVSINNTKDTIETTNESKDNIKENNVNAKQVNATATKEPTFIMPVDGEIIKGYAKENLVFSDTLQEWIIHQAIDIKADARDVVKAAAEGTVKSIKNDPRYGLTVIIEHSGGFETVYSNLLTAEFVVEGEKVKQGQTIGTVGTTAMFEIADETHLHFEMLKNSEYVDPSLYIK